MVELLFLFAALHKLGIVMRTLQREGVRELSALSLPAVRGRQASLFPALKPGFQKRYRYVLQIWYL